MSQNADTVDELKERLSVCEIIMKSLYQRTKDLESIINDQADAVSSAPSDWQQKEQDFLKQIAEKDSQI